jgi:hypothetical protein
LAYNSDDDNLKEKIGTRRTLFYIQKFLTSKASTNRTNQSTRFLRSLFHLFLTILHSGYFALLDFIRFSPLLYNNSPRSRPRSS